MKAILSVAAFAALSVASASAQVTVIATETFDYPTPSILLGATGGTGWADFWDIDGLGDGVVVFDQTIQPPLTCSGVVGSYAGQAIEFLPAVRSPDTTSSPELLDGTMIGADGATVWISFRTQQYQVFGDSFGALQLFQSNNTMQEQLLLGSPWATNAWGIDDDAGTGLDPEFVAGTNAAVCANLVYRIDHMLGDERIRMWIDPVDEYPTTPADLDTFISDLRWDQIRLNSGGSGTHFFWDDITIAKGVPSDNLGTSYCGPAVPNSSGASARIVASGSTNVAANMTILTSSDLPTFAFGFSLVSDTTAFIPGPGGSQGNLCITGALGRYVGPGQIMNSGATGSFSLQLDLAMTPQPTGFISIQAGQTWNFQTWFRDSVNGLSTSNFTDGVAITFQ